MTDLPPIPGIVEAIEEPGCDIRIVRIRPDGGAIRWRAGQYMELTFPGFPPRPYSIGCAPYAGVPEFHIRRAGIAGVSHHVAENAVVGDKVSLRGPFGAAGLIEGDVCPVVLVAGGMGLPPMRAIVDQALHDRDPRPITLYWGTRTAEEMYLKDYFLALAEKNPGFKFVPVVGAPVSDVLMQEGGDLSQSRIYLAGPPAMIEASVRAALHNGAALDMIHSDDIPTLNLFRKKSSGVAP